MRGDAGERPSPSAPRALGLLARLVLPSRDREFIVGDLEEIYTWRSMRDGAGAAGRRYLTDLLASALARVMPRPGRRRGRRPRLSPPGASLGAGLLTDVQSALRTLRRESGFTALVILTLALGVGSTAVVFGMVDQLLLQPLPGVHDGGRAAYLEFHHPGDNPGRMGQGISTPDFDQVRKDATLLDGMASYGFVDANAAVGAGRPVHLTGMSIYGDFFEVLGVRAAAGGLLRASETALGSDPLRVVISRRLSDELFGSGAQPVGRTVQLNGHPFTVVGVAGGGFRGPVRTYNADFWVPYTALVPLVGFRPASLDSRNDVNHMYLVVRPRTGVSLATAGDQLRAVFRRLVRNDSDNESGPYLQKLEPRLYAGIGMAPIVRAMTGRSLRLLGAVVILVLLIACANVANLLLFRNVARRGAVATRRALGASPSRIAREHLVRNLVLGALGAVAGLGIGWVISYLFKGQRLTAMPAFRQLTLDHRVALFAALAAVVTAVLFGTVPALLAGRFELAPTLKQSEARHTKRLAVLLSALSAGQLGLTLSLVVGALLLIHTVRNLYAVDIGIDVDHVWTIDMVMHHGGSSSGGASEGLYREVLSTVEAVPGVQSAAIGLGAPPLSMFVGRVALPNAPAGQQVRARMMLVTPGWLGVLRAPVRRGREFRDEDWRQGAPDRVVLTASLARRLFGRTDDVVGRTVVAGFGRNPSRMRVVGVVGDMRAPSAPEQPQDELFITYSSATKLPLERFTVLVRTRGARPGTAQSIRSAIEHILPNDPVPDPQPLSTMIGRAHSGQRLLSHLLTLLAGLAALLAAIGLYGIIAFVVAGRRREFGIRLALGAEASRIAGLVFRSGAVIIGAGTLFGLGGAYTLSRVLRSRLFGVGPLDPASYLGGAVLLALVAAAACWIPAYRATQVDPVATLREE